ncbi:alanine racemase [Lapillicoccus sp.]|uniref:alanine racemase n=1 Tax=Lapillicoccus sp. TaxID=1909287 RepID=UPI0039830EE0
MALVFHVDGPRWRRHLSRTVTANPGIVPVTKGNGYGFGLDRLLAECARLHGSDGVGMIAVGTHTEAPRALAGFPGDVLVMEPYRPVLHQDLAGLDAPALVHTIASPDDLVDLVDRVERPRVVLEGLTSMNRHGMPREQLHAALADLDGIDADLVGVTLHLPLGTGQLAEAETWLREFDVTTWFVSHVRPAELASLRQRHPERVIRPRIGTSLWLGEPAALSVRAHVLDVREVSSGDRAGYRQRRVRDGHLLVVSGGTAHGVAMEAPTAASTLRQRGIAVAEGLLQAAGRIRAPFTVSGRDTWFVEPPHMQVSLITLPGGAVPPQVGDEVEVRVRHTTMHADDVVLS